MVWVASSSFVSCIWDKIAYPTTGIGFKAAKSTITTFKDGENETVVRLDFVHRHPAWEIGQHFFLCFPELSVWQSHPFTPASVPRKGSTEQRHLYIVRCLKGETARLSALATKVEQETTPVILTGPFGGSVLDKTAPNILAVAGGTGISFALPMVAAALEIRGTVSRVELVWIIKQTRNIEWIEDELDSLLASFPFTLTVRIFVTRESSPSSQLSTKDLEINSAVLEEKPSSQRAPAEILPGRNNIHIEWLGDRHPDLDEVVQQFIHRAPESGGKTQVLASGPAALGRDLRAAVAAANDGAQVWRGNDRHDVGLYWDNRFF